MPSRRRFIKQVGWASGGLALAPSLAHGLGSGWELQAQPSPIFTLGVASGDPTPDAVVIWTRLAPDPLDGGGMGTLPVDVSWEVAADPWMSNIVHLGTTTARPGNGHAVSVNVDGLLSDCWYYYRFSYRGEHSRVGRTRTLPAPGAFASTLSFAAVSCQDYEAGYYAAYRDIARQDLDLVFHLGDYIYEGAATMAVPAGRRHSGGEATSLVDYRNRYALYRLDPDLQTAHALFPLIATWDDHEVDNNYAGLAPEDNQTALAFFLRRAAAYKAYVEAMPLRPSVQWKLGGVNLYRAFRFGRLAEFFVLDGRQMRTDQPCGDGIQFQQSCPAILDPEATMLGDEQEGWLLRNLKTSPSTWKVLAQQVMMMQWDLGALGQLIGLPSPVNIFNVDAWDGYQAARSRLTAFLGGEGIQNAVVLTGDIHSSWAGELLADFANSHSQPVGAEFVCSGITSRFGDGLIPVVKATLPSNPHVRFFDGAFRGYIRCTVTPDEWRTDYRAVVRLPHPVFTVPSASLPLFTLATFTLSPGEPGLTRVT